MKEVSCKPFEETVTCIKVFEFGEQNAASTFQPHTDEGIMTITQPTCLHTSAVQPLRPNDAQRPQLACL